MILRCEESKIQLTSTTVSTRLCQDSNANLQLRQIHGMCPRYIQKRTSQGILQRLVDFNLLFQMVLTKVIGVAAPVASITLVRTISMSAYQKSKYTYAAWIKRHFGIDPLVHANTMGKYPNVATVACFGAAGATAGALITFVACKLSWLIESRSYSCIASLQKFMPSVLSANIH
jgi:hypothetical protein